MKIKIVLILFINCVFNTTFPQEVQDRSFLLSRFRVSGGFVTHISEKESFKIDHPFLNISYRSSDFDKFSSSLRLKGAFEIGVNGLLIADRVSGSSSFTMYPLPYAKAGPELRLYKNIFLAANGGLAFIYFVGSVEVIPFAGLNGFYLIRLSNKTCIEFETGFHIPATSLNKVIYLAYFTIGISFD